MAFYHLIQDPETTGMLEADLWRFYQVRLSDLFKPNPPHTLREVLVYVNWLPEESVLKKYYKDDPLTTDQHLLFAIIDALNATAFESKISAMGLVGAKDYRKIANKAPKALPRPTLRPKKKEIKFTKVSDLKRMLEAKKKIIHHTPECVQSGINKGGGKLKCNCT